MSKTLERKLLAEMFDANNKGDSTTAYRLFKRHLNLVAKSQYALLEAEDAGSDFEITDMGDDFNDDISSQTDEDSEKLDQAMLAVDELEELYSGDSFEEVREKFDEVRNAIDEQKLMTENDEEETSVEDAKVAIEDLKADFEAAGCMDEQAEDLFNEIECAFGGCSESEEDVEVDVADDDSEVDIDTDIEEAANEDMNVDLEFDETDTADDETSIDDDLSDEAPLDSEPSEETSVEELSDRVDDMEEDIAEILASLDIDSKDKETVEEGFTNIADPRKKMTSEGEGINKKGTMNFGKLRGMTLDKKAGLGVKDTDSKGISADKKVKVQSVENKGSKTWSKTEKPANKPASSKSLMGK